MSPHAALHSPIFRAYGVLVLAIMVAAAAALRVAQLVFKKDVRKVWLTYEGWLLMLPLAAGAVFLGRFAVIAGTTLLAIFGFKEFARATGLYRDWWMTGAVYASIAAVGWASWTNEPHARLPGWYGLFMAMPAFAINLILAIPILRNRAQGQLQLIALSILGFTYIGWMFGHLGFLADTNNPYGYLLYVVVATELNDVAAFTCGKLFGRRQFRSNVSPRKTWGGALGAAAISIFVVPFALRFSLPNFTPALLLLTGAIVGIGGQFGDLSISVIKRDIGIKDMGAGIPGHGGVLDRIDSLIFVAPLFLHAVNYWHGLR